MFTYDRKQDLFNNACKIISQNGMSMRSGICMYRGENGTRCALGWSIDDDVMAKSLEFETPAMVNGAPNNIAKLLGAEDENDVKFLQELQQCHDPVQFYLSLSTRDEKNVKYIHAGALLSFAARHDLKSDFVVAHLESAERKGN